SCGGACSAGNTDCSEILTPQMFLLPVSSNPQQTPHCPPGWQLRSSYNILNVATGNLVLNLGVPRAGAFDPVPTPFYNLLNPAAGEFGYGWTAVPKQTLTSLSSTAVQITNGQGATYPFTNKDVNNNYLNAFSGADALSFNPTNNTWTQT